MTYVALRFDADADSADAWADALLDAGALSVDVADAHAGTADEAPLYGEPGAVSALRWPVSRLTALFAGAADLAAALAAARGSAGAVLPPHETFDVRRPGLGARDAGAVRADPHHRAASGSCPPGATRSTPRRSISRSIPGSRSARDRIRRRGSACAGSRASLRGGESRARLRLRIRNSRDRRAPARRGRVVGTDIDPQALVASRANAERNGVDATFVAPDELAGDEPPFDVVVANILANPLIAPRAGACATRVRAAGASCSREFSMRRPMPSSRRTGGGLISASARSEDGWIALVGNAHASA